MATNTEGAPMRGDTGEASWLDDGMDDQYMGLLDLTTARLAGLGGAVRSRPKLIAGLGAAAVGALVGLWLSGRGRKRRTTDGERRVQDRTKSKGAPAGSGRKGKAVPFEAYAELVPLALKLAENPLVRGM